jgi:LacI family transcriptional regulator
MKWGLAMTIKDIARLSGYGVSTVSRALNGHPDVNEETREKIKSIVKQYKFVPNSNARQLKQSISKNILVMVKGTFNLFFAPIIEYMQAQTDKVGYSCIVHYLNEDDDEVKLAERFCREQKPVGIVFLGINIEPFKKSIRLINVPCVLSTTYGGEIEEENISSVSVDDVNCGKMAVDYLFDCGHKKIGVLSGSFNISYTSALRFKGCQKSFEEHGMKLDESIYETCAFSFSSAYEAANALLKKSPDITAIFAMSDTMAIGAARAIADMGKKVPDDISIIGFDGTEMAQYYNPKITTIRQPATKIAELSIKQLLDMIDSRGEPEHILLTGELIEGESVKRIN